MAELKLPFSFTPGQTVPADQVQVNFDTLRQLVQDLNDKVEAFDDLVVSGTFENTGKLTTNASNVVTIPGTITNTDKFLTDADGNVNQPAQPAFLASLSLSQNNKTGFATVYTVICDSEVYDNANNYDSSTGIFTAPKTGQYLLITKIRVAGLAATDFCTASIVTSNRTFASADYLLGAGGQTGGDLTVVANADMEINDTAKITIFVSGEVGESVDILGSSLELITYFTGTLIN